MASYSHEPSLQSDSSDYSESDLTEVIDFSEIEWDKKALEHNKTEYDEDPTCDNEMFHSEDPKEQFQCPLILESQPPKGIPVSCKQLLWFQWAWYIWLRSQLLVSESLKIQCAVIRGYMSVHNDRYRHLLLYPFIIHPYSNFTLVWEIIAGVSTAIGLVYSPYMIAFRPVKFYIISFPSINGVVTAILLVDTVLHFFTGTVDPYSREAILDYKQVVTNYLTGWFAYDVICRFPWDVILFSQIPPEHRILASKLTTVRFVSFAMRIMRYRIIHSMLKRLATIFAFRGLMAPWLIKLLTLFLFTLHWLACFHWLVPDMCHVPGHPKKHSWITYANLWEQPHWLQYINCYLRSLGNLLTLDGGSKIPREPEEILTTTIGIFLSLSLFGYFIASFTIILGEHYIAEEKFGETIDLVEGYLIFQNVPENYREKVLLYFEKRYHGHIFADAVLLGTLSPNLRSEVTSYNCKALVQKVSIFNELPPSVILDISEKLKYDVFVPGDILIEPNTVADRMYFIQDGEVNILSPFGTLITTLSDGHFFGEIALITGEKRTKTAVAKTLCEIYILTKKQFQDCVSSCPEVYERILQVAQTRMESEFNALLEAAKKQEEFKKWKEANTKLKKDNEEDADFVYDTNGLTFVGEYDTSSLHVDIDKDHHKRTDSGRIKAAKANTSKIPLTSKSTEDETHPEIGSMLTNVKDLASSIKKHVKKKKKKTKESKSKHYTRL